MTIEEFGRAVRGKLVAERVVSLDDSELCRALANTVSPKCLPLAKKMRNDGLTIDALYAEFKRRPGDWLNEPSAEDCED